MNWLRTKWGMRGMAALLLASLLPVTVATAVQTARHTSSFADWVRTQLRQPAGAAFEQALETALAARPPSLEAFLRLFVDAYEAQQPDRPLAEVFASPDLSNEALITYLQSRFLGLVGTAVLPPVTWVAAPATTSQVFKRGVAPQAVLTRPGPGYQPQVAPLVRSPVPLVLRSLSLRFVAQPRGP